MPSVVSSPSWLWTQGVGLGAWPGKYSWHEALSFAATPARCVQTNQCHCGYGSQECPLPAQALASGWLLGPLLVPLAAQWVTRHSVSAPAPAGSWYAPQPCWAKLALRWAQVNALRGGETSGGCQETDSTLPA